MSIEKTLDELLAELSKLANTVLPSPEQLGGWTPFDIVEGADMVLAWREEGDLHVVRMFKAEGDWRGVYEYLLRRNELWAEIDRLARREERYLLVPITAEEEPDESA